MSFFEIRSTSYDIPYGVVKIRIFKYYRYLQRLQKSNQKHSRTSTMLTFISMGVKNQIFGLIYSIIQELITFMFHWITKEKNIFLELKLYSQRDILFRLLLLKLMLMLLLDNINLVFHLISWLESFVELFLFSFWLLEQSYAL